MINEKSTKAEVLAAVGQDGHALRYASDALKADRDVVLEAVSQNGEALYYASDALKADRGFMLEAGQRDPWVLGFYNKETKQ